MNAPREPWTDDRLLARGDAWGQTFEAWREEGALVWRPEFFGGAWVVTRHAQAQAALRDPRLSVRRTGAWVMSDDAARQQLRGLQGLMARALLFVDAPDHGRLRALLAPAFAPAALQALAAGIEADVQALLDALPAGGDADPPVDLVATLTRPLPARVIGRCLGLVGCDCDGPEFLAWSEELAQFLAAPEPSRALALRAQRALLAMVEPLERVARERPDSLPGRLQAALDDGRLHDRQELLAQLVMLLFAGYETTRHLLGSLLLTLWRDPARWQALGRAVAADGPATGRAALAAVVREALRRDCPVRYTARRVACDFEWDGQRLRRGQPLLVLLSSALRDPRQFDAPLDWRPQRGSGWALAFGSGAHVCLGAALTQIEAETVLRVLLQRWPQAPRVAGPAGASHRPGRHDPHDRPADAAGVPAPAVAGAADRALHDGPAWIDGPLYRGLSRLPVWLPGVMSGALPGPPSASSASGRQPAAR
ncbi:cytochrome P450 [Pseudaquabacterium rugosum]|uniref:Cytochrome P450 n=1 Tax=Pseudaquabacterium rugosum TaxID=2984194 RepID=A0ABU9BCZ4_9BURK